ncbi:Signal transduction histidine kinase [Tangfeifania diversioriginum]|uniref:histidine kinase n=1 Tax=Tangfeifania diversioriginum TaxID=1168035 RepID=A0A1M6PI76_9BACT|nr:HAMP domain-containing sensor histidine kinase [Tangfeifania diversioriginum]SHK07632.1 Signal transduction histidine kinase [Tangfeifania diversioriginum]
MRLIKRTYIYTSLWMLPIILIGSIFSFLMIEYVSYEEIDEFLTYEMERLVEYHEENNDLPEFHQVARIIEDVKYEKPFFKDTLLLEPGDNEMVPYRELWFSINHNGRDFTLVIQHLMLGRDDIAQGALLIISGIVLLILLFAFLSVNRVTGKIWTPFYDTLHKITRFKISEPPPEFTNSDIDEFNALNSSLSELLKKIKKDYQHNKEFNENASHELQTHLAVIKSNAGKLLDNSGGDEKRTETASKIYSAATQLSQVQKSLLLLSKINNREFSDNIELNLEDLMKQVLELFAETITLRQIKLSANTKPSTVFMDKGLAEILINNLIKNAVKHNIENGYISINLSPQKLEIKNSGEPYAGNPEHLLQRFSKGKTGISGIGLAIVKEICDLYNFEIQYDIKNSTHKITIHFSK